MSQKKKILIIGYGGTIVMVVDETRKAVVPAKNLDEILAKLPTINDVADIDMDFLSNEDSTNVGPNDWTRIAIYIRDKHDQYDAFVITHGTNTLAYTASALTLALGTGLKKPIVLTGSQLPLSVYGNDARFNFENAIKTAAEASKRDINEVMIVFSDTILRGCRSVKSVNYRFVRSPHRHSLPSEALRRPASISLMTPVQAIQAFHLASRHIFIQTS